MALTQTQAAVLSRAAGHRHGRVATETYTGRGGRGGGIKGGYREHDAALALRDCDFLALLTSSQSTVYSNGYGCSVSSRVWAITDAGRAAIRIV